MLYRFRVPLVVSLLWCSAGSVALGQVVAAAPPAQKLDLDAGPAEGAPDPLAPPDVQGPAPAAPGSPAPAAAEAPAQAETDPVVISVRHLLETNGSGRTSGAKEDLAGLVAFYARPAAQPVWTTSSGLSPRATLVIAEIGKADDWGLKSSAFELPGPIEPGAGAEARAAVEIKLGLAVLKYARHARGGRVDPSSISRLFDQKPVIFEPKSLLEAIAATESADGYLRALHPKHPQFQNLQKALLAARGETSSEPGKPHAGASRDQVQRILVNMERWRWMPDNLGEFYVWDSVPEQLTRVIDKGEVVLTEKIVVGKPNTPTPIFSADMQFVIFHPEWGVPDGIKTNELGPQLRKAGGGGWFFGGYSASSVLKAHGLRVTYNGHAVDPDSINWASANVRNYSFVQPAGATNVLGIVKFRFPNKHDVYMHDTPERHLFNGGTRAFSHGCMRVQNPIHLAEVLLAHDKGWSKEKVQDLVRHGGEIKLGTQIPVHITYFTAVADDAGKVTTRGDIYGLDGRVASALEGSTVHLVASASETAPEAAAGSAPRRSRAAVRNRSRTASSSPSTFNPSSVFGGH